MAIEIFRFDFSESYLEGGRSQGWRRTTSLPEVEFLCKVLIFFSWEWEEGCPSRQAASRPLEGRCYSSHAESTRPALAGPRNCLTLLFSVTEQPQPHVPVGSAVKETSWPRCYVVRARPAARGGRMWPPPVGEKAWRCCRVWKGKQGF